MGEPFCGLPLGFLVQGEQLSGAIGRMTEPGCWE